jgi:hypothetical protein
MTMHSLKTKEGHMDAIRLLTDSFYQQHPFWRVLPPDVEDVRNMLNYRVAEADKDDGVFGFFVDGVMVGVFLTYRLENFVKQTPPKSVNSKLFSVLAPYIEQARQKMIELGDSNKNTFVTDYSAIKVGEVGKGHGMQFYAAGTKRLLELGADAAFGRVSNPVTTRLVDSLLGFETVLNVPIVEKELEGYAIQLIYMRNLRRFGMSKAPKAKL